MTDPYADLIVPAPLDPEPPAPRWTVLSRDDLDRLPPPDPLIAGLLPRRGLAVQFGKRGLGKTLIATSLAGTLTTDLPTWMGLEVVHHGPVLYVGLEGVHGLPERIRAWEARAGRRASRMSWITEPMNLRSAAEGRALGLQARDLGAVALFVDSARAAGAGREDTEHMGAFVAGLEAAVNALDGLVVVLHNSGWDEDRERGSTLLGDAADTVLRLKGDPQGVRYLDHTKHRDGDHLDEPLALTFHKVQGTRSGVLLPAPDAARLRRDDLTERQRKVLTGLPASNISALSKRIGIDRADVSRALKELVAMDPPRAERDGTNGWKVAQPVLPEASA